MKKLIVFVLGTFLTASCSGWFFQPSPYTPPTPFLPPTNTPSIVSPTPVAIGVNTSTPVITTPTTAPTSISAGATSTDMPTVVVTETATVTLAPTATIISSIPSISVEVLGCNTSIDVTHNLGEVTNAYVTLKNTGSLDLTNIKATLNALDEGLAHPDKTVEMLVLPIGYQVTIKLTVDSTYREATPVQIEVTADLGVFQRIGVESCRDLGLFAPKPDALLTPVPLTP